MADNAAPITSTPSRRRNRLLLLISTCVTAQTVHLERRGRTRCSASRQRRTRHRAQPHGHNRPAQSGHSNSPATKARSTSSGLVPTIFNSAYGHQEGPSRSPAKVRTGRALARSVETLSHEHRRRQQEAAPPNHPHRRSRYTNRASSTRTALNTYLVTCAESSGVNRIASFDRSIDRVGTIERIEPPATRKYQVSEPRMWRTRDSRFTVGLPCMTLAD